jgi:murein DD-endopeptidase MepM/ murein hydrolase activator NlpD
MRIFIALALISRVFSEALDIQLPTENHFLFSSEPEKFYMYVDRDFEGQKSKPWQAGSYGLVRTSLRINDEVIETKFHEGIDISPINRDQSGVPLDPICAIASGKIAYISDVAGRSNYGKYIVIEHNWENSSVFSLYAHLAKINCKVGDIVQKGTPIATLGFTGEGITKFRAHLHLEICLMLSGRFEDWDPNTKDYHGAFNGINLCGIDVGKFFTDYKANANLTISQFLANYPVYYKITMNSQQSIDLAARYPWLVKGDLSQKPLSWEISFSNTGMPLSINPSNRIVTQPIVTYVKTSTVPHRYRTRGLLLGEGANASLSADGQNLLNLLTGNFPIPTPVKLNNLTDKNTHDTKPKSKPTRINNSSSSRSSR